MPTPCKKHQRMMLVLKAKFSFLTPNWKEIWLRLWRLTIHQASYLPLLSAGNLGGNMWILINIISLKDVDRRYYAYFVRVTIERQRRQRSCKSHRCGKTTGKKKKARNWASNFCSLSTKTFPFHKKLYLFLFS